MTDDERDTSPTQGLEAADVMPKATRGGPPLPLVLLLIVGLVAGYVAWRAHDERAAEVARLERERAAADAAEQAAVRQQAIAEVEAEEAARLAAQTAEAAAALMTETRSSVPRSTGRRPPFGSTMSSAMNSGRGATLPEVEDPLAGLDL